MPEVSNTPSIPFKELGNTRDALMNLSNGPDRGVVLTEAESKVGIDRTALQAELAKMGQAAPTVMQRFGDLEKIDQKPGLSVEEVKKAIEEQRRSSTVDLSTLSPEQKQKVAQVVTTMEEIVAQFPSGVPLSSIENKIPEYSKKIDDALDALQEAVGPNKSIAVPIGNQKISVDRAMMITIGVDSNNMTNGLEVKTPTGDSVGIAQVTRGMRGGLGL